MATLSNLLASEPSPYLRQHASNPVHWKPWGDDAFVFAVNSDRPVFLSIGYSACHWCHVMEHESFMDEEVAAILNRSFVCIKVDREERPDVDEAFMNFVQISHGRGGWPLSAFLTARREPFFGGTYWPKEDWGSYLGFKSILQKIEELWKSQRGELLEAAAYYGGLLRQIPEPAPREPKGEPVDSNALLDILRSNFDPRRGGFGTAPKFPPHAALTFLLDKGLQGAKPISLGSGESGDGPPGTHPRIDLASEMALRTLEEMALGGIHDHVGGGFHRYSTDVSWHLPHFEKMLYDNALLLGSYATALKLEPKGPRRELFEQAATGIVDWLEREMSTQEGLFLAALDADSEGEEGKYYVWSQPELSGLGCSAEFLNAFGIRTEGNFHDEATGRLTGENVLHLISADHRFPAELTHLFQERRKRVPPQLDDKAIVAWNSLAIEALSQVGRLEPARRCARAILDQAQAAGQVPRFIWRGQVFGQGFLEDYAFLAKALFVLSEIDASFESDAHRIGRQMIERFYDHRDGGFFATSAHHEDLFSRTKPVFDQPIPSANSAAIEVLIKMGERDLAATSLVAFRGWMDRAPTACESLFVAERHLERTLAEAAFEFLSWTDGNGPLTVEIGVKIRPGWSISPAPDALAAWAEGVQLRLERPSSELSGEAKIVVRGLAATTDRLELRYEICSESECLPSRTARIKLPIRTDILSGQQDTEKGPGIR